MFCKVLQNIRTPKRTELLFYIALLLLFAWRANDTEQKACFECISTFCTQTHLLLILRCVCKKNTHTQPTRVWSNSHDSSCPKPCRWCFRFIHGSSPTPHAIGVISPTNPSSLPKSKRLNLVYHKLSAVVPDSFIRSHFSFVPRVPSQPNWAPRISH